MVVEKKGGEREGEAWLSCTGIPLPSSSQFYSSLFLSSCTFLCRPDQGLFALLTHTSENSGPVIKQSYQFRAIMLTWAKLTTLSFSINTILLSIHSNTLSGRVLSFFILSSPRLPHPNSFFCLSLSPSPFLLLPFQSWYM